MRKAALDPRIAASVVVVVCLLLSGGCSSIPKRGDTGNVSTSDVLSNHMNPLLLTTVLWDRAKVEIDWVEGCAPQHGIVGTLTGLQTPSAPVLDVFLDDEIPRSKWATTSDAELAAEYCSGTSNGGEKTGTVYILFAPFSRERMSVLGAATMWVLQRGREASAVPGIVIYAEQAAYLWLTPAQVVRSTLVHEWGHLLGLVCNPAHSEGGDVHCSNARCVMAVPNVRVILANFAQSVLGRIPERYCATCAADISAAQRLWTPLIQPNALLRGRLLNRVKARELMAIAVHQVKADDHESARSTLERAVQLDPDDVSGATRLLVDELIRAKDVAGARSVLRSMRSQPFVLVTLAQTELLCRAGDYTTAAAKASPLLSEPFRVGMRSAALAVRSLEGAGKRLVAVEALERAVDEGDVSEAERRFAIREAAGLLRREGEISRAAALIRKVRRADDRFRLERAQIEAAYGPQGRAEEQMRALSREITSRRSFRKGTTSLEALEVAGIAAALGGDRAAAEAVSQRLSEAGVGRQPGTAAARARIEALLGQLDDAMASAEIAGDAIDPCVDEFFQPVHHAVGFAAKFPFCAQAP